jgi:acyl-ACP thioesterase
MENTFQYRCAVMPSMTDHNARLSLKAMMNLFMDAATMHASQLGVGAADILPRGLFWLTTKTMVIVERYPQLMEQLTVTTWPLRPEGQRCYRDYTLSCGDEIVAIAKTLWVAWNIAANAVQPVDGLFPADLAFREDDCCPHDFTMIDHNFTEDQLIGRHVVVSGDIDLGRHVNNVAYVSALLNFFSSAQLDELNIRKFEINYLTPCTEGETLSFYRREKNGGLELTALKENGHNAILVRIN